MHDIEIVGYSLSPQQQRVLSLDPQHAVVPFVTQARLALHGRVDQERLRHALDQVVARHEILRTRFVRQSGLKGLLQVIMPESNVAFEPEQTAQSTNESAASNSPEFDLAAGTVFRAVLKRISPEGSVLYLAFPALCMDAHGIRAIARDLAETYTAETGLQNNDGILQYADIAAHFNDLLQSEIGFLGRQYWAPQLSAAKSPVAGSFVKQPCNENRFHPERIHAQLSADVIRKGRNVSGSEISGEAFLLSCWQGLLHRISGMSEFTVGYACNGRDSSALQNCAGLFERYLPLETCISPQENFGEFCRKSQDALKEAVEWQSSFEWPESTQRYHSACFSYYEADWTFGSPDFRLECLDVDVCTDRFDIKLALALLSTTIEIDLWYNSAVFRKEEAQQFLSQYVCFVGNADARIDLAVSEIDAISADERHRLLDEFNTHAVGLNCKRDDILCNIAEQVKQNPNAAAVISGSELIKYSELERRANQLAWYLQKQGAKPEVCIAICMERSLEMVVALLGILKTGAAYVPLEPNLPMERLAYMLQDSRAALLVTQEALRARLPEGLTPHIALDSGWGQISREREDAIESWSDEENLAYVIYTSGSTGRPKGVGVTRKGLNNYVNWASVAYRCSPGRKAPLGSSLGFDLTVTSLWPVLITGGCVVLAPEAKDPMQWLACEQEEPYQLLKITPAHLRLLEHSLSTRQSAVSEQFVIGGEALQWAELKYWKKYAPMTRLINEYGPTETVVGSCIYEVEKDEQESGGVPIGRPIVNTRVFVLDERLMLVPTGAKGELYIGGAGVARGYLNRPELTAERFVPDPFSKKDGERLYRTGDIVRWSVAGQLEYLGRKDNQVKVRGYRIELGEIESVLSQHPGIKQAVVIQREDEPRDLVGYVVRKNHNDALSIRDLKEYLEKLVPVYMVPGTLVFLKELPLTANGKINRKALPAPKDEQELLGGSPNTITEQLLTGIWEQILKREGIGRGANFFNLGGHSLAATQMISRIRNMFSVEMPLRSIFANPTLAKQAEEIDQLRGIGKAGRSTPIRPVSRDRDMPVSYAQQRLWFMDILAPESPAYNIPFGIWLRGNLNIAALQWSFDKIVERHETLRTSFLALDGIPIQRITPELHINLEIVDLAGFASVQQTGEIQRLAQEQMKVPFDLSQCPLLRLKLLKCTAKEHVLLVTMHHIISDGWSIGVMAREFGRLYEAYIKDGAEHMPLPDLQVQYADYAVWQREWLQGEVLQAQLGYWKEQLRGAPAILELPTDRPRPRVSSYRGAREAIKIPRDLAHDLRSLSRAQGATLYMVLLCGFQALLSRYADQTDVVVGTTIAGRTNAESELLIGMFVNMLALRSEISQDSGFQTLLGNVRETLLDAYAHQHVPFEKLVSEFELERNLGYSPIFQITFEFQNTPQQALALPDLQMEWMQVPTYTSKFDMSLSFTDTPAELPGVVDYNPDLFDAVSVQRLLHSYISFLQTVVQNPHMPVSEVPILSETEKHQLLAEWNDTHQAYSSSALMHELFETAARANPDAPAVFFEDQQLTYEELESRSNQLAHHLQKLGISPDARVGICLERSLEMPIGLMGILKAGAAYVPLEPSHPAERLIYMLQDSGAAVVVTQERLLKKLPATGINAVCLDTGWKLIAEEPNKCCGTKLTEDHLAYVCYTSGSTGKPKGVGITHGAVVNYMRWAMREYILPEGQGAVVHSSIAVDMTVTALLPLFAGQPVRFLPEDPGVEGLAAALRRQPSWSLLKLTPTHLSILNSLLRPAEMTTAALGLVIGGDNLLAESTLPWRDHAPSVALINEYGPTETVVGCCIYRISEQTAREGSIPIGKPIANMRVYVLDRKGQLLPAGVRGEIYIGGAGLARGYLGNPGLTAEKFVPNPFSTTPGERLYRTGDQGRYLSDGNLLYLGRNDHQVKIRGFRIELGEVESVLSAFSGVNTAVAMLREDEPGDRRLVAYLLASPEIDVAEIRQYAKDRLPDHMVPSTFIVLDELPLSPSGKLDRTALPRLVVGIDEDKYSPPRSEVECTLCEIWASILKSPRIGVHDNFFELGGDSILCIQVIARAREAGLQFTVRQMFEHQTIAELSTIVSNTAGHLQSEQGLLIGTLPLSPIQHAFFGWNLAKMEHFNHAVLLALKYGIESKWLEEAISGVLKQHDALRTKFERDGSGWAQSYEGIVEESYERVDLASFNEEEQNSELDKHASCVQAGLDLQRPRLVRVVEYDLGSRGKRLLLVIHHLVVDGVSWRIVLEDLERALNQLQNGQPVFLGAKTTSYRTWSENLQRFSSDDVVLAQLEYWSRERFRNAPRLPLDYEGGDAKLNLNEGKQNVVLTLDAETTEVLLHELNGNPVEELLLTAVVRTLCDWLGSETVLISAEGHGREELFANLDLSHTVGWFTSLYPLLLETGKGDSWEPGQWLQIVKAQLHAVPMRGIGFGLLRYLNPDEVVRKQMQGVPQPEVSFNYLGQFDNIFRHSQFFSPAQESIGKSIAGVNQRQHILDVHAMIIDGKLQTGWSYSERLHRQKTVEALANRCLEHLRELIVYCGKGAPQVYSAADFPLLKLNEKEFARVAALLDE